MKIHFPQEILDQKSKVDQPLDKDTQKTVDKIKINTKRDTGDPSYDLIQVFEQRDIADMDDEEYKQRIIDLRKMREMRFTTTKKKTALDLILASITVEKAREYLAVFKAKEEKEKAGEQK